LYGSVIGSGHARNGPETEADLLLTNMRHSRGAEAKVWNRLRQIRGRFFQRRKVVGVLGCMAERLKEDLFQDGADLVVGPDAYRDLPRLQRSY
jgi:tRNA-2-methylthio-N6-dimethylallyladenosine synthase